MNLKMCNGFMMKIKKLILYERKKTKESSKEYRKTFKKYKILFTNEKTDVYYTNIFLTKLKR